MRLMTVKEYAESANLPVSRIRTMIKQNKIPAAKFGVSWRIDADAADKAIADMMHTASVVKTTTVILKPKNTGSFLEKLKAI